MIFGSEHIKKGKYFHSKELTPVVLFHIKWNINYLNYLFHPTLSVNIFTDPSVRFELNKYSLEL